MMTVIVEALSPASRKRLMAFLAKQAERRIEHGAILSIECKGVVVGD